MEERKLIYLINPIAGTRKKQQLRKMIERETSSRGLEYAILPTHPSGNYDDVIDLITAKGFTDVIAVGGDGTVNHVVQSMRHLPIKLQAALSLIFEGSTARIDAFMINQRFSCLLSGLGLDARVAHEFAKANSRGLISYTQQSLLQFFKAQPYLFEIVLDQFSFFTDAFFISVANSNQFGNQVTIAPQASLNDGLLDIVIVQKMHKAKLPFAILKQIRNWWKVSPTRIFFISKHRHLL
jgi:diacylglycerol kinase family enzyme